MTFRTVVLQLLQVHYIEAIARYHITDYPNVIFFIWASASKGHISPYGLFKILNDKLRLN